MGVQGPLQEDANGIVLARGNLMPGTFGGTAESAATGPAFVPLYQLVPEVASTALATTTMGQAGPH